MKIIKEHLYSLLSWLFIAGCCFGVLGVIWLVLWTGFILGFKM